VQYRESDLDFVSRLLEEEGIYYYFEHTADGPSMVLCESPAAHVPFFADRGDSPDTLHFLRGENRASTGSICEASSQSEVYAPPLRLERRRRYTGRHQRAEPAA
jgi:uncharacterized protein involved in type VI secretion and phage assembly